MTESNAFSGALPKQADKLSGESFAAFKARPDIKPLPEAMAMSAGKLANDFQTLYSFAVGANGDALCVGVTTDLSERTLGQIALVDKEVYLQLKSE